MEFRCFALAINFLWFRKAFGSIFGGFGRLWAPFREVFGGVRAPFRASTRCPAGPLTHAPAPDDIVRVRPRCNGDTCELGSTQPPTNPPTTQGASGSPRTWPRTCPDAEQPQQNAKGHEGGRRCPPPRGNSIKASAHHLKQAPTIPPPSASAEEQGVLDQPTRVFQLLLPSPFRFLSPCPVLPGPWRSCPPPKVLPGPCT